MSRRIKTVTRILVAILFLGGLLLASLFYGGEKLSTNFLLINQAPSADHPFGTDWLGRDMLVRTVKGLGLSFVIGSIAACISSLIALVMSMLAVSGGMLDKAVTWLVDLFLSVPHIVLLLLLTFAFGGGFKGVVLALALTHWPSLARLLRAELLQIKQAPYVGVSRQLGKGPLWIARHHYLPQLAPQLFIGFLLLFPHAILHEAAITFLGFALSAEQPAIGIILSESMQYLATGAWWLALFPGFSLLLMVALFDMLGRNIQLWMDPFHASRE